MKIGGCIRLRFWCKLPIDLILTRKALQYVKVCDKFQKPMKLEEQLKVAKEGQAFLKRLAITLHKSMTIICAIA